MCARLVCARSMASHLSVVDDCLFFSVHIFSDCLHAMRIVFNVESYFWAMISLFICVPLVTKNRFATTARCEAANGNPPWALERSERDYQRPRVGFVYDGARGERLASIACGWWESAEFHCQNYLSRPPGVNVEDIPTSPRGTSKWKQCESNNRLDRQEFFFCHWWWWCIKTIKFSEFFDPGIFFVRIYQLFICKWI